MKNEITIYKDIADDIYGNVVSLDMVKDQLDTMEGDIDVRINSRGGSVFEGFAIYNLLEQYKGKVTVYIDGLAASIASVIALAGDEIHMAKNSRYMIHNAYGLGMGDAKEMRKTADLLDSLTDTIAGIYAEKAGGEKSDYLAMMSDETWFTADEALAANFANSIISKEANISNNLDCPWINKKPETKESVANASLAFLDIQKKRLKLMADA